MVKRFGFWTLVFLVIANMIGAGVFTTSGYALQELGSPRLVMAAWALGGLVAASGAFSYGLLVTAMPDSGGEYLFLSRAVHPLLGFIAGWVSLIAGFTGAIAFAARAFEEYVLQVGDRPEWLPSGTVAVVSILLAGALHGARPRAGAYLQNTLVLLKLGLLTTILIFAATRMSPVNWSRRPIDGTGMTGWTLASAFAGSLVWISLSYSGFNAAVYVAGEVDRANRQVPRALVAGTLIVVVFYLLLNFVFVYAPSPGAIRGKADVAAIAARALGGSRLEMLVRWTVATCLLTSVFSMMMAAPRVYAKMADDGLLAGRLRFREGSPYSATVMQALLASLLVLISSLRGLLTYLGLTLSISAACAVCCLFLPAIRTKPILHPIHAIPAFYIAGTAVAAVALVSFDPWQLLGTTITFAVGIVAYFAIQLFQSPSGREKPTTAPSGDRLTP